MMIANRVKFSVSIVKKPLSEVSPPPPESRSAREGPHERGSVRFTASARVPYYSYDNARQAIRYARLGRLALAVAPTDGFASDGRALEANEG